MAKNPMQEWIDSLDEAAIDDRVAEIDIQIGALQKERLLLMQGLDFKRKLNEAQNPQRSPRRMRVVPEAHLPLDGGPPVRGKTDAALRVLGSDPNREWNGLEIGEQLIKRGWMEDTEGEYASLLSTLSRLYAEGKIYRPYRGHYRLSPPDEEVST